MIHFFKRALAYNIDCILVFSVVMLLLQWAILTPLRGAMGIEDSWFHQAWNLELYVLLTISLPVWLYFIFFDSEKSKGTLGKRLLKLQVQDAQGQRLSLSRSAMRTFFKLLPWELVHLGVVFPTPLYFDPQGGLLLLQYAGAGLFVLYALSIVLDKANCSVYDRLLQTSVT